MIRKTAEIIMKRSRIYIIITLISHFRKKTIMRKTMMTAMLSRANAIIDHFRNAGVSIAISPVMEYDLDG
jgi:hypothetical protein